MGGVDSICRRAIRQTKRVRESSNVDDIGAAKKRKHRSDCQSTLGVGSRPVVVEYFVTAIELIITAICSMSIVRAKKILILFSVPRHGPSLDAVVSRIPGSGLFTNSLTGCTGSTTSRPTGSVRTCGRGGRGRGTLVCGPDRRCWFRGPAWWRPTGSSRRRRRP